MLKTSSAISHVTTDVSQCFRDLLHLWHQFETGILYQQCIVIHHINPDDEDGGDL
jgi:hypothetical protein